MPDFAVTTAFKAKDQVSRAFAKMGRGSRKFGDRTDKDFKRASLGAKKFKSITGGILKAGIVTRGLGLMRQGVSEVLTEFLAFDKSITVAAAKFPERIRRGTKEFELLKKAARDVGATTEFTAAQAAAGLEEYAKAGIDANSAMSLLAGTAELATNANVEFAQAADFALTALDAFNLRSKDAAKTAENLKRVNDTLTTVVTSAKLEIEDFNETLKFTGPVAAATGASLEDVAVLTGVVAKAGIKGSLAGTALKNTYLGLAAATPRGKEALEGLGIAIVDSEKNMRPALDILKDFSKATEGMGNAQRLATIEAVFGRRSVAGVTKILSLGSDELDNYSTRINNAKDASALMAEEIRKSLSVKIEKAKSAAIELGFKFIEAFEKDGKKGIEALTTAIGDFDVKPVVEEAKKFFGMVKSLFEFLWDNRKAIKVLVKGFIAFKLVMAGIGIARAIRDFGGFAKALWKVVAGQRAMKAMGITKPMAPGVAGPAQIAGGTVFTQKIGDLTKSAQGVMTMVGGAISAAAIGWQVGTWIEESLTGPMNEAAAKVSDDAMNAFRVAEDAIRTGELERLIEAQKNVIASTNKMEESFLGVPQQILTTESFAQA
ncbi:MAG: phage tail tape measure protein, partial [Planctomycetota bacterium]